jgi:hypothetical protein
MPNIDYALPESFSVIDDLTPTLTWSIDDTITCVPAQYTIEVWSVLHYLPGASAGYLVMAGTSTTESFSWPSDGPALLPGHSYYVYVNQWGLKDGELWEDGGTFGYFSTGPQCSVSDVMEAPSLRWPPDNWRVDPTVSMDFEWDNQMTCWPDQQWYIEISKSRDFSEPIIATGDYPLEDMWIYPFMEIPWENCTRYYWHVRPDMTTTEDEPWSETWSFVTQPGDMLCPIEIPVITPIPPAILITLVEANCRSGPTTDYPLLSILSEGNEYEIRGRNQAGDSWLVLDQAINDTCWVAGDLVEVLGDISQVEVVESAPPPPTPTNTPVVCSSFTDKSTCEQYGCTWDPNYQPSGRCK